MEWPAWTYEALPKTLLYAALLMIVGTAVSRWMVIALTGPVSELDQALERFGVVASVLALAALLLRALGHTATVFGAADALRWSNIRVIAIESRWGQAWRLQLFAAVAVVACAFAIRLKRRAGWFLYSIAAFVLCAMIPRLGHGATSTGHLVLHILHLVGVSAWLGTLTVIVWLYFRNSKVRHTMAILLQCFSKIALPAAGLAVITGVIAAAIYVESFSNLLTTTYGRTLLLKAGGFVCIAACGWSNWRRMGCSKAPRPQTLIVELVFAAAVVVITGVLTETDHP